MKTILIISFLFLQLLVKAQTESIVDSVAAPKQENYTFVEQMPEFPGGQEAMLRFISKNVKYPEDAMVNNVEGKVLLKFVVNTDGYIQDIEVVSKIRYGYGLEDEAIRVLKKMPQWTTGKQNGKPVNVYYILPISFRLK